jgi:hypothetical protein
MRGEARVVRTRRRASRREGEAAAWARREAREEGLNAAPGAQELDLDEGPWQAHLSRASALRHGGSADRARCSRDTRGAARGLEGAPTMAAATSISVSSATLTLLTSKMRSSSCSDASDV